MPHRLQGWPAHHPEPPPWLRKSAASQAGRRSQPLPPQQHLPLTCAPAAPSPHEVSRRVPGPSAPRAAAGPGATRRATSEPAACYDPWPRPGRAAPPRTRGTRAGMGERGGLGARCGAHLPPPLPFPPPSSPLLALPPSPPANVAAQELAQFPGRPAAQQPFRTSQGRPGSRDHQLQFNQGYVYRETRSLRARYGPNVGNQGLRTNLPRMPCS